MADFPTRTPSDLHIQATPELLDGWCGPVVLTSRSGLTRLCWMDGELYDSSGWCEDSEQYIPMLRLDLARAECRDRVARVAGVALGIHTTGGAKWVHRGGCEWALRGDPWRGMSTGSPPLDYSERRLCPYLTDGIRRLGDRRGMGSLWSCVPALADLDPTDDTRLPDGSRRVDAQALGLVWEAVCAEADRRKGLSSADQIR